MRISSKRAMTWRDFVIIFSSACLWDEEETVVPTLKQQVIYMHAVGQIFENLLMIFSFGWWFTNWMGWVRRNHRLYGRKSPGAFMHCTQSDERNVLDAVGHKRRKYEKQKQCMWKRCHAMYKMYTWIVCYVLNLNRSWSGYSSSI